MLITAYWWTEHCVWRERECWCSFVACPYHFLWLFRNAHPVLNWTHAACVCADNAKYNTYIQTDRSTLCESLRCSYLLHVSVVLSTFVLCLAHCAAVSKTVQVASRRCYLINQNQWNGILYARIYTFPYVYIRAYRLRLQITFFSPPNCFV